MENQDKALQQALAQIEKQFGKGSIMQMDKEQEDIEAIPTGSINLNIALGIKGIPKGRIVEVYGPESSGKTTLMYHLIAECQKEGGRAVFIDSEHSMDAQYAARIGVKIEDLLVSQPDHGEQALEIADTLVRSGVVDLIAIDSVAALTPKAELEGVMGQSTIGLQARMMSQALRKLAGNLNNNKTTLVFTNQIREKVGVMFGSPETQPGGRALRYYASVRMDIRRKASIKGKDDDGNEVVVGNETRVKIVKNKVAPPFREAEFDIMFGEGISRPSEILGKGVDLNILTKSGAFYSYGDLRLGQGKENAKNFLKDSPELMDELEAKIMDTLNKSPEDEEVTESVEAVEETVEETVE